MAEVGAYDAHRHGGQGSIWQGLRLHFGDGSQNCLEGREQSCKFHFEQGITRLTLEMHRQGHEVECDVVRTSANNMVMNEDKLVCHEEYKRRFCSMSVIFISLISVESTKIRIILTNTSYLI